jgi:hypothetical protein
MADLAEASAWICSWQERWPKEPTLTGPSWPMPWWSVGWGSSD